MGRNNADFEGEFVIGPKQSGFRSSQISASQHASEIIRNNPEIGRFQKAQPARYTSEEGRTEGTPKVKGMKPKRIRQAFGRE